MAGAVRGRRERIQDLIQLLNSIHIGELSAIDTKLVGALEDLQALEEAEMGGVVADARAQLARGDVMNFRRLVAQAVSRLGHLR